MSVMLHTNVGTITIDLYVKERPQSTRNFIKLCKAKYYNNCLFFNVQSDFIVQSGDPTNTGRGGTSLNGLLYGPQAHFMNDEMKPPLSHKYKGVVGLASTGENQNTSQFYITTVDGIHLRINIDRLTHLDLTELDEKRTIFGRISEGWDALNAINGAFCDDNGRPYQNIRIHHVYILDDPFPDPPGLEIPDRSPDLKKDDDRLEADEPVIEEGKTLEELEEERAIKEQQSHQKVLEMVGDIPDADIRPPDNVLFICKINAATREEDLHLIFSRFGPIKTCEIIKDKKTGDSLQYGFIEFESERDCETAFWKMNNVLVDDRRIRVDFSQSVSKLKQKYGIGKFGDQIRKKWFTQTKGGSGRSRMVTASDYKEPNAHDAKYPLLLESDERAHSLTANYKSATKPAAASDERRHRVEKRDDRRDRDERKRSPERPRDRDERREERKDDRRDDRRDQDKRGDRRDDKRDDRRDRDPKREERSDRDERRDDRRDRDRDDRRDKDRDPRDDRRRDDRRDERRDDKR